MPGLLEPDDPDEQLGHRMCSCRVRESNRTSTPTTDDGFVRRPVYERTTLRCTPELGLAQLEPRGAWQVATSTGALEDDIVLKPATSGSMIDRETKRSGMTNGLYGRGELVVCHDERCG